MKSPRMNFCRKAQAIVDGFLNGWYQVNKVSLLLKENFTNKKRSVITKRGKKPDVSVFSLRLCYVGYYQTKTSGGKSMCGIVGYVGTENAAPILIDGLSKTGVQRL